MVKKPVLAPSGSADAARARPQHPGMTFAEYRYSQQVSGFTRLDSHTGDSLYSRSLRCMETFIA
jgi:hypothetical protein